MNGSGNVTNSGDYSNILGDSNVTGGDIPAEYSQTYNVVGNSNNVRSGNVVGNNNKLGIAYNTSVFGDGNKAVGAISDSLVFGNKNSFSQNNIIVGSNSESSGTGSIVIGNNAKSTAARSIAIGTNSVADRSDTVSFGSSSDTRSLIYISEGIDDTDAVNVKQMKEADEAVKAAAKNYTDTTAA
ncbi:adhesin, partial [Pectobacterium atrosepticum ICMP 1526]